MTTSEEICLFWIQHWFFCLTKAEWAAWVQGVGTVAAVLVAVLFPIYQARRQQKAVRKGHLETIATDLRVAERQASVYLDKKIAVPAYRLHLYGDKQAIPALLADGTLTGNEATKLIQWYVDAYSFNYNLDLAQQWIAQHPQVRVADEVIWEYERFNIMESQPLRDEVRRIKLKAGHLVAGRSLNSYDKARIVLLQLLPPEALERLDIGDVEGQ
jgi:hypothetical protein